jgi:integrase
VQLDGSVRRRSSVIGSYDEYPSESAAQQAADALRLDINQHSPRRLLKDVSVDTLTKHYREYELPDIFHDRKPVPGTTDELHKSYSTQYAYEGYLKRLILPRWRSYRLIDVKAVDVENWLKSLSLARGSKAKIRNIMSALFSHAIRWEWTARNPITSVRQSAKRLAAPDVLTPEELASLLLKLPEPLRTAAELDAFTGLRRGELIGLQWQDVDFENLTIHVRRSVVMMVAGLPKTEASAKDVPLDATLAESLLKLRLSSPYNKPVDWVFASPRMKGKQPYWPDALWKRYGRVGVTKAGIAKRVAFHTFRHTFTTLLTQNGEDVKVVQELLRHANSRITLDLYAQAGMAEKRLAQSRLVKQVLKRGAAAV